MYVIIRAQVSFQQLTNRLNLKISRSNYHKEATSTQGGASEAMVVEATAAAEVAQRSGVEPERVRLVAAGAVATEACSSSLAAS